MTVFQQREELKKMYPGSDRWAKRVDNMSEDQVTAIYLKNVNKKEGNK